LLDVRRDRKHRRLRLIGITVDLSCDLASVWPY
jgi:hypothetical protein